MKTNEYLIHPFNFLWAVPTVKVNMDIVDCTELAKGVEVYEDQGFVYSEYKPSGSSYVCKVGYYISTVIKPVNPAAFLLEVLIDAQETKKFGSIIGGRLISSTKFKPNLYLQCGEMENGVGPRIIKADRNGMTYTTAATEQKLQSPFVEEVLFIGGPEGVPPWKPSKISGFESSTFEPVKSNRLHDAGTVTSFLDFDEFAIQVKGVQRHGAEYEDLLS